MRIKFFEDYKKTKNKYWKIRTENPWFDISLDKITETEEEKKYYSDEIKFYRTQYVYIGTDQYGSNISVAEEDFDGYEFQGEPLITKKDIEKWNFENDAKKYNL